MALVHSALGVLLVSCLLGLGHGRKAVQDLTSRNFQDKTAKGSWMIAFTAPWCGHCKNLKPQFEKAAKQLEGSVNFGNIDATQHRDLAVRFGVSGYPTLFHISEDGEVRNVDAVRSATGLREFAKLGWKRIEPKDDWKSPLGTLATTQSTIVRFGYWIASFDESISNVTGIPKVGVQFAMVLIGLMVAAFLVVVAAYVTTTQHKPQFRPMFDELRASGRRGRAAGDSPDHAHED